MKKACIFDLDGTILNTIDSIAYFANKALEHFGLNEFDTEKYKIMVGDGAKVLVKRMLSENGVSDEKLCSDLLKFYTTTYDNDFLFKTTVYDGVRQLLDELKKREIKIAILSNKPHITTKKLIDSIFGDNYFNECYGKQEMFPPKPDTKSLFALVEALEINLDECLYIGDTGTDMKTGKAGGIFTIGVLWGFRKRDELEENGADAIISHPNEILKFIN